MEAHPCERHDHTAFPQPDSWRPSLVPPSLFYPLCLIHHQELAFSSQLSLESIYFFPSLTSPAIISHPDISHWFPQNWTSQTARVNVTPNHATCCLKCFSSVLLSLGEGRSTVGLSLAYVIRPSLAFQHHRFQGSSSLQPSFILLLLL